MMKRSWYVFEEECGHTSGSSLGSVQNSSETNTWGTADLLGEVVPESRNEKGNETGKEKKNNPTSNQLCV